MFLKVENIAHKTIPGFANFPLRLAGCLAFVLANLSGFSIILVILFRLLNGNMLLKSQASILAALVALLGAVQIISLGVIGETIGRLYDVAHSGTPLPEWAIQRAQARGPIAR